MSFKIKPNKKKKRKTAQEQAKADVKTINLARNLLGLSYDLPDALEDGLLIWGRVIERWAEEWQRWAGPGTAVCFLVGEGECHLVGFKWLPKFDLPTLPAPPELWKDIAGDIGNANVERAFTLSLAMMGEDARNQAREFTQTTSPERIPCLVVLACEDAGYIGMIGLPTWSELKAA